jgi:hypothetical protein
MLWGFRHREGSPAPRVDERAQPAQGLNGAARGLCERQACAAVSVGHPRRQTGQRPVSQRDDKAFLTVPTLTPMHVHFFAEQRVPRIVNRDGVWNVSSL